MSKSLGNVIDPWEMINKYGVDTLRLWMYSVNQAGESKRFDERSVDEVQKRIFNLIDNVYTFYDLFRDKELEDNSMPSSSHPLDLWILARLALLTKEMTEKLDEYRLLEPTRSYRDFVDDLSTWFVRRSRDRIKSGDNDAKKTLYFVLKTISKLLAPFAPFAAEDLYQKLRNSNDKESVHLESWPKFETHATENLIKDMQETRRLVTLALEARSKANIKVRQPLALLKIKNRELKDEFLEIIKDEINVKSVQSDVSISEDVVLDTALTPDLIEEGRMRDLIRSIQEERKEKDLKPQDIMEYKVSEADRELFKKFSAEIKSATNIEYEL
jgi:isoleucyl-tRNA synthetase